MTYYQRYYCFSAYALRLALISLGYLFKLYFYRLRLLISVISPGLLLAGSVFSNAEDANKIVHVKKG